jgi:hypothetical protein
MLSSFSAILQSLTIGDIISDIPHDAGAFVAYVIIAMFIAFIWIGSRQKKPHGKDSSDA